MNQENINDLIDLAKIVIPAMITLASGFLGYQYGISLFKKQKRLDFIERQIREFYSPMVGCLKQINAMGELRFKIEKVSNSAWKKIVDRHPFPFYDHESYFKPFKNALEYENNRLLNEIFPLYDRMVTIFSDNYWLAETETQKWYSDFYGFVEVWHRWVDGAIPAEVLIELGHKEESLHSFYQHLDDRLILLRNKLTRK